MSTRGLARKDSFFDRRQSILSHATKKTKHRRGFAEPHPSGRLRRVLILYTGGTIGMMPSPRGYVCKSGYLPKLLQSLPMFHDPNYDLSQEDMPTVVSSSSDGKTSPARPAARTPTKPASSTSSSTTTTTPLSPLSPRPTTLDTTSSSSSYDQQQDQGTPRRLNQLQARQASTVSSPLITPVSEFGRRTLYHIKEYDPLLDSCNITSIDWRRVAQDIVDHYDAFDAFIILHGTDTMAYTASALSFMLQSLCKTVVITGSQIPLVRPRNDGVTNLLGALAIAGHFDVPEVLLFFGSRILRGCRASKVDCTSLENAFNAPNQVPLGTVGIGISIQWTLVKHPPKTSLKMHGNFCNEISILRIYPGQFTTLAQSIAPPLKGLILQTFGTGNGPDQDA